jgi:hypothetical protein
MVSGTNLGFREGRSIQGILGDNALDRGFNIEVRDDVPK